MTDKQMEMMVALIIDKIKACKTPEELEKALNELQKLSKK